MRTVWSRGDEPDPLTTSFISGCRRVAGVALDLPDLLLEGAPFSLRGAVQPMQLLDNEL